jgi:hypothetical protein
MQLQRLPLLVLLKPPPVQSLTPLPLVQPMQPKPLPTLLLKPPKPLPSLRSNCCTRAWCPGTKKPPTGGFFVWVRCRCDSTCSALGHFRSLASN